MAKKIQVRRDTAANWISANPILASGEIGYETDTGLMKIGNNNEPYDSLYYHSDVRGKTNSGGYGGTSQDLKDAIDRVEETNQYYGIQFVTTKSTTQCTRIGNMDLHAILPVQSLMRRCLLLDNGNVNYYLDANNSSLNENGQAAILDGTDGQVVVEIQQHYKKFETFGTMNRILISLFPLAGYIRIPKMYISAYEPSLNRSTSQLASVVNTSPNYRGGNNTSAWDLQDNSLLGMPVTNESRTNFRTYARNRGSINWNIELSDTYKAWADLLYIEFANLNSQESYNPATTAQGYKQGGLGSGVTDANSGNWSAFNSYNPFIPCGTTNALGNNTGVVDYAPTGWAGGKVFSVPSYRGIENPFGHIWKWMDGINLRIQSDADGGKSEVYVANTFNLNDINYNGYTKVGEAARSNGYISRMIRNQLIPEDTSGASSNTFWADYFYTNIPNSGESLRGVLSGGAAASGANAGLACSNTYYVPSRTRTILGSRLIFLTEEMT